MDDERLRLRSQDLDWLQVEQEIVALDGERSLYLAANPTGALLWEQLGQGATRAELVERLHTRFPDVDEATLERDVEDFIAQLRSHDLLEG